MAVICVSVPIGGSAWPSWSVQLKLGTDKQGPRTPEVLDKQAPLSLDVAFVPQTQQIRGVYRDDEPGGAQSQGTIPQLIDYDGFAQEALGRGGAERHDHLGLDELLFELDPKAAGRDFAGIGPLVQPAFAALGEFEVLDCVGDIGRIAVNAGLPHCFIKQAPRRSDERPSGHILSIARLFAYEHDRGRSRTLAEYRLCCMLEKVAPATFIDRLPDGFERLKVIGLVI